MSKDSLLSRGSGDVASGEKSDDKPLKGLRIGIVSEFMVKHSPNDGAVIDLVDKEFKTVLCDRLGAELVESVDPQYPDDPDVPNMKFSFADAFAEILPISAPRVLFPENQRRGARVRGTGLRRDRPGTTSSSYLCTRRRCRRS